VKLHQGNGGWYRVDGGLGLPGRVYFRVQEVEGHLRMTELYLDGRGTPLSARALREFPVQGLEHWAASMRERVDLLHAIGPDLSRLAAYFSASFGKAQHWVADSFRAQYDPGVRQARMPRETFDEESDLPEVAIELPADGRLSDQFLSEVARAYELAVKRREAPAKAIARAADVSPRTVHRWVYTARKRGLMEPATSRGRIH